jgi:nicotinate-nucleotide--dimethylbenzimidazole phosphoribosyltransferase
MQFGTLDDIAAFCRDLPKGDAQAGAAAAERQAQLTKPPGSLGRLEELAAWMAQWQGKPVPRIERAAIAVFAGNHGVVARGVSAFPQAVTAQMVQNFAAGGAAINQLAKLAQADLRVVPIDLERPTADFTMQPAMSEGEFLAAFNIGYATVKADDDLLAIGEMGIGNTTAASALCAALLGGGGSWAGRGTGVEAALACHAQTLGHPLQVAAALGGRELAAMAGAVLAARRHHIPTLLDGFVATAAVLPLASLDRSIVDHCRAAHVSAESGHRRLLNELNLRPLLDLDMRLGEASGAALAIPLLRAALACHAGMATFAQAGVSDATD